MGSEMPGPGDDAPGPTHVAASAAYAWAIAAANAAVEVPALNAEAAAWAVRGWADVAVGCLALDDLIEPAEGRSVAAVRTGLVRSVPRVRTGLVRRLRRAR
jgi:hypothetical protein